MRPAPLVRDFVEGLAAAILTVVFAVRMFPSEASLVAVCLAALLTVDSLGRLGEEVRGARHPVRALAARIAVVFAGAVVGDALLALFLPEADFHAAFARQLAYVPDPRQLHRGFGDLGPILLANLYVLGFFFVVAFGFRKGGLMLAVGWNASVWGAVFGALSRGAGGGRQLLAFAAAAGPHMLGEAAAYVLAGLAGVLMGRGALRLAIRGEDRWDLLLHTAGRLLAAALGLLLLAGAWEASVAGPILRAIGP